MLHFYRDIKQDKTSDRLSGRWCIETTHTDPDLFLDEAAMCFESLAQDEEYHTMDFQAWMKQIMEIACKLKGYKANVEIQQIIRAGSLLPSDQFKIRIPKE